MSLEYAEMNYSGTGDYFKSGWNYVDSSQSILYLLQNCLKFVRVDSDGYTPALFWYNMLTIMVLVQSSLKFLQLIRYNEPFCFLVEMLVQVTNDIYPFCIVLFTFCGVFTLVTAIMEGDYDTEEYFFMSPFPLLINVIQTFRNSIGDL